MLKIFVLVMVVSGASKHDREEATAVVIQQEFTTLQHCQLALKSITSQVHRVHSSGCYEK